MGADLSGFRGGTPGRAGRGILGARTQPIINTATIGAFARFLESPRIEMLAEAIREEIPMRQ